MSAEFAAPCNRRGEGREIGDNGAMGEAIRICTLSTIGERELDGLCAVLIDCVDGGASVSFMQPMSRAKAESFWRSVAASMARGERLLLVATEAHGRLVGTVQVVWAEPENQPHRADIAKMLVHRDARRRGVGAALLDAAEHCALAAGRTLLVLDTVTGGAGERLYERCGWQRCGVIPGYALWPGGGPCATTIFFKTLAQAAPGSVAARDSAPAAAPLRRS